jgi:nucleoside-diphosphate-sugar epimerase
MQTILVAGGAGFIGSHLCRKLLEENFKVICLDNFITGEKENISSLLSNINFSFKEVDITKDFSIDEKVDYVFHLASPASPNAKSPRSYIAFPTETLLVNSVGTYNLLKIAKENQAKFLYVSSSEIYGDPDVSPQVETYNGNVSPNGIRSVYDEGKRFGEAMTMAFFRKHEVNIRIIRIFNTFGPTMRADDGRVVSNFINQAIKNEPLTIYGLGNQTRSFCYIDDMIDGLRKAMFSEGTNGEVFNLGNPDERTVQEMAELIKKMANSESKIEFESLPQDDPKNRKPDIAKAKRLLNWEPKVSIEMGLEKTIQYFKSI